MNLKRIQSASRFKSISIDFMYNILASLILTGVSQVILYPFLAYRYTDAEYGTILTIIGVINTLIVAFGNTLNNVRLIMATDYDKRQCTGDFNILLAGTLAFVLIANFVICIVFFKVPIGVTLGICFFAVLGTIKSYYSVAFRLVLDFKKILFLNIVGAVGYLLGIGIVFLIPFWVIPFVLSEFLQIVYIFKNSNLQKEPYKTTPLLKDSTIKYSILIVTGFFSTLITYLDRIIIYPLLGASAVSTYTVASYFGKALGILMTPIAGVLLGYYAQKNFKMSRKLFWTINLVTLFVGVLFMVFVVIVAPPITKLLYPTIFEKASPYIFAANLAATINVLCSLTQSSVLKFAPTWVQIVKEVAYGFVYVLCGYLLLNTYGLMGFCVAAIAANAIKLLVLYVIGSIFIGKDNVFV